MHTWVFVAISNGRILISYRSVNFYLVAMTNERAEISRR